MQGPDKGQNFVGGRIRAVRYVWRGMLMMIGGEHSFQTQTALLLISLGLGWYLGFSSGDWALLALAWGLILTAETLNTAIERLADKVEPAYDEQIRDVKDLAAGGVGMAALAGLAVWVILILKHL
ncbi:MAG: diacylglycerol kinase family protein [Chlorobi bacterium]|nr:diacylglycerol kinase family protein [Chlorobiota bacterium]